MTRPGRAGRRAGYVLAAMAAIAPLPLAAQVKSDSLYRAALYGSVDLGASMLSVSGPMGAAAAVEGVAGSRRLWVSAGVTFLARDQQYHAAYGRSLLAANRRAGVEVRYQLADRPVAVICSRPSIRSYGGYRRTGLRFDSSGVRVGLTELGLGVRCGYGAARPWIPSARGEGRDAFLDLGVAFRRFEGGWRDAARDSLRGVLVGSASTDHWFAEAAFGLQLGLLGLRLGGFMSPGNAIRELRRPTVVGTARYRVPLPYLSATVRR